ncbi:MAG: zinc ribbon domain-containing protein [Ruminococcaceae bacterium]|nr:zinc ribbon domain-containing protein [Oscillospiraceae bacterium]
MAIINCPECGKEISDTIESCIHCGFVLKKEDKKTTDEAPEKSDVPEPTKPYYYEEDGKSRGGCGKTALIVLAIVGVLSIILFACVMVTPTSTISTSQSTTPVEKEVKVIDTATGIIGILEDDKKNSVAAKEKYGPYRLRIELPCTIDYINENYVRIEYEDVSINVSDENDQYLYTSDLRVCAYYEDDQLNFVTNQLQSGQQVIVIGDYYYVNANTIYLENCSFEIVEKPEQILAENLK